VKSAEMAPLGSSSAPLVSSPHLVSPLAPLGQPRVNSAPLALPRAISCHLVQSRAISAPLALPKTTCLPSSQSQASQVTKNWQPAGTRLGHVTDVRGHVTAAGGGRTGSRSCSVRSSPGKGEGGREGGHISPYLPISLHILRHGEQPAPGACASYLLTSPHIPSHLLTSLPIPRHGQQARPGVLERQIFVLEPAGGVKKEKSRGRVIRRAINSVLDQSSSKLRAVRRRGGRGDVGRYGCEGRGRRG